MFEEVSKEYLAKHEGRLLEQPNEAHVHGEALIRMLVQKVAIGMTAVHDLAEVEVHVRISSILAA